MSNVYAICLRVNLLPFLIVDFINPSMSYIVVLVEENQENIHKKNLLMKNGLLVEIFYSLKNNIILSAHLDNSDSSKSKHSKITSLNSFNFPNFQANLNKNSILCS